MVIKFPNVQAKEFVILKHQAPVFIWFLNAFVHIKAGTTTFVSSLLVSFCSNRNFSIGWVWDTHIESHYLLHFVKMSFNDGKYVFTAFESVFILVSKWKFPNIRCSHRHDWLRLWDLKVYTCVILIITAKTNAIR